MISVHARRPLNRWDHDSIRPGPVGSVGETHLTPRLKTSMHGQPIRWGANAHEKECRLGANVSDGYEASYTSGGMTAAVHDSNWGWRDSFRTERGWIHQDLRAPDRATMEMMGGLPQYSWHNTLATVHHARVSGENFLPLPGGYGPQPGDVPRGGNVPRLTDTAAPSGLPLTFAAQTALSATELAALTPNTAGNYSTYSGVAMAPTTSATSLTASNLVQAYRNAASNPGTGGGLTGSLLGVPGLR